MTDTPSPINKALNAVFELFKSPEDKKNKSTVKAYIDDSRSSLEDLAEALVESDIAILTKLVYSIALKPFLSSKLILDYYNKPKAIPVLIGMENKNAKNLRPYYDLLGQLLKRKENPLGVNDSIHLIVPALLKYLQNNGEPKKREHTVSVKPQNARFQARIPDIQESKHLKMAASSLLDWAKLESHISLPTTSFCRLASGMKPMIYVFDDYINFIDHESDTLETDLSLPAVYKLPRKKEKEASSGSKSSYYLFEQNNHEEPKVKLLDKITEFYSDTSSSQPESLIPSLKGFAGCLNNLAVVFDVQTLPMDFKPLKTVDFNYFQQVAKLLQFSKLDQSRNQIAAFIIDLEWLPSPEWIINTPDARKIWKNPPDNDQMGYYAVRLLTQRYPEIPCFIFTGMWRIETLQQSLAAGAAWCFQKPTSHHLGSDSSSGEELNYINLERHLTEFAKLTYGAYDQIPNHKQLDILSNPAVIQKIEIKAEMTLSIVRGQEQENDNKYIAGQNLRKLIAKQFTADIVQPIKVLDAGRSGAKATFFAKVFNEEKEDKTVSYLVQVPDATRFIKMDSWFTMQLEYLAYQNVIKPKLNNHVAHIIQRPSCTVNDLSPEGMIVSSLAGFPEDFSKLKTLQQLIKESISDSCLTNVVCEKIYNTLKLVLLPLYQNPREKDFWMGEAYFPIWNAKINPLIDVDINEKKYETLTEDNIFKIIDNIESNSQNKNFWLDNWQINRIHTKLNKTEILLSHPQLGRQIKVTGHEEDIHKRFNSLWIRSGMTISCMVSIDSRYQEISDNLKVINGLTESSFKISASELLKKWSEYTQQKQIEPFGILNENQYQIKGSFGTIHGDLNTNNILYPDGENVGFLIDFANTKKDGLIAFDLSSLEARIWGYHLIPQMLPIARSIAPSSMQFCETALKILHLCLESSDLHYGDLSLFESKVRGIEGCQFVTMDLFLPVTNALKMIHSIREFSMTQIEPGISIKDLQMCYALGVSSLVRVKSPIADKTYSQEIIDQARILAYLCASYYLSKVVNNFNPIQ
jgi:Ternary complex associated domain 9